MGELAVGERRLSWDRPGRSAVLGLLAACLGIERQDEAPIAPWRKAMAMRIECCRPAVAAFHTIQVPRRLRNRRFATRAEELAVRELETVLSRRDYRSELLVLCALWPRAGRLRLWRRR